MAKVFPPPKSNPITKLGGLISEYFYSWVVAMSGSNNDLEDRVTILETVPSFTAPTLLNSWIDFGSGKNPAGYFRDPFGIVHLRGVIKDGTATALTVLFTLPIGFRPSGDEMFPALTDGTTFPVADLARIDVQIDGDVVILQGNNTFLSLDGISFRAV